MTMTYQSTRDAQVHATEPFGLQLQVGSRCLLDVDGALRGLVAACDVAGFLGRSVFR